MSPSFLVKMFELHIDFRIRQRAVRTNTEDPLIGMKGLYIFYHLKLKVASKNKKHNCAKMLFLISSQGCESTIVQFEIFNHQF